MRVFLFFRQKKLVRNISKNNTFSESYSYSHFGCSLLQQYVLPVRRYLPQILIENNRINLENSFMLLLEKTEPAFYAHVPPLFFTENTGCATVLRKTCNYLSFGPNLFQYGPYLMIYL
jgi:hypothetical protein